MNFWNNFERECKNKNIKPSQIGKILNIAPSSINGWKNGSPPNSDRLLAIADYFGVSTDYLLGRYQICPGLTEDQRELLENYKKSDDYGKQQIRTLAKSEAELNEKEME